MPESCSGFIRHEEINRATRPDGFSVTQLHQTLLEASIQVVLESSWTAVKIEFLQIIPGWPDCATVLTDKLSSL